MTQRTILFDLDGTLSDSAPGIMASIEYAFEEMDLPFPGRRDELLGPPLKDIFSMLHVPEDMLDRAVKLYRIRYGTIGKFENTVYDGIPELLGGLVENGDRLALATSKPDVYAVEILEHFGLAQHFTFIGGATLDGTRGPKAGVVAHTLAHLGDIDLSSTVMVGDRLHDVHGAAENGLETIGVLWGYGDLAELTEAGAKMLVETPTELADILLG
jgi:phosphoglycolate phosphatase